MSITASAIRRARKRHEEWVKTASKEELREFLKRVDPNAMDIPAPENQGSTKPRNGQKPRKAKRAGA